MKKFLLLIAIPVCLLAAGEEKKSDKGGNTIPPGAVKVEEGTYKYTDAQGKKWIYRQTPFAIMKIEDTGDQTAKSPDKGETRQTPFGKSAVQPEKTAPAAVDESTVRSTKVREEGDTVYFERPGPFGTLRWSRNKSALSDEEKTILERKKNSSGEQKVRE